MTSAVLPDGFVSSLFSLENRVAVVTGGASGLGAAIAAGLAQAGAAIAVVDVDAERAAEVCASIVDADGTAAPFTADVTDSSAVDRRRRRRRRGARRRRRARQQRRHRLPLPGRGVPRGSIRRRRRAQPEGHVPAVPALRPSDARARGGAASSTSRRSAASSPTRTRAPTSRRRAASCSSRARSRSSGSGGSRVNAIAPTLFVTPMTAAGCDAVDGDERLHPAPDAPRGTARRTARDRRSGRLPRERRLVARHRAHPSRSTTAT